MKLESNELIALIERTFPTHPISKVTLRQRTLADQGMSRDISDEEWESAGRIDRGVPWTALSDNDLMECQDAVAHLCAAMPLDLRPASANASAAASVSSSTAFSR